MRYGEDEDRWSGQTGSPAPVHAAPLMSGRLTIELFTDPLARDAYSALSQWSLLDAVGHSEPEVAKLLERLAVEDPMEVETKPPDDMVVRVVVTDCELPSPKFHV